MREVMSQLKVEAVHFLQAPEGESCAQCAWSLIWRQRSVLRYVLLTMPKIRASISTVAASKGLERHETKTSRIIEIKLFLI